MYRRRPDGAPGTRSLAGLIAATVVAWTVSPAFGGQAHVPPLFFAAPVLWAALRHRRSVAVTLALVSGVLAGPLTPADVDAGTSQPLAVWTARALLFLLIAVLVSREVGHLRAGGLRDPLTGLRNRIAMSEMLETALARARRRRQALGLLYIDLDEFKVVNDTLGHASGDELLRTVAERLTLARPDAVIARQGGDEFIVLLEGLGDPQDQQGVERSAATAVESLLTALEAPLSIAGSALRVRASAGLSLFPADGQAAEVLQRHADAAMYAAKVGGARWNRFVPEDRDPLIRLARVNELSAAIEQGDFELHYQPVFEVGGDILGVEALVRWRRSGDGLVPPAVFIPLAEESGLIDALGDWVLTELCRQARIWSDLGYRPHYGFNVAPRQLLRPGFAARVQSTVAAHDLDAGDFVIELTESAWALEGSSGMQALADLQAAGFSLAIDDFGAGYSSLSRIRKLSPEVIKIDRGLLEGVPEDPQSVAILVAIFRLAAACDSDVVAEGVERAEQYAFLREQGCRLAQGFGLGRPMAAAQMTDLLARGLTASRRSPVAAGVRA